MGNKKDRQKMREKLRPWAVAALVIAGGACIMLLAANIVNAYRFNYIQCDACGEKITAGIIINNVRSQGYCSKCGADRSHLWYIEEWRCTECGSMYCGIYTGDRNFCRKDGSPMVLYGVRGDKAEGRLWYRVEALPDDVMRLAAGEE